MSSTSLGASFLGNGAESYMKGASTITRGELLAKIKEKEEPNQFPGMTPPDEISTLTFRQQLSGGVIFFGAVFVILFLGLLFGKVQSLSACSPLAGVGGLLTLGGLISLAVTSCLKHRALKEELNIHQVRKLLSEFRTPGFDAILNAQKV